MKNRTTYLLIGILLIFFIPACIDEYTPEKGNEISDILVVEGTISGGENTVIKLSRSVALSAEQTANPVSNARIYVERNDGVLSNTGIEETKGEYRIIMEELNPNFQYSLVIYVEGKEYRSKPEQPLFTPEIDSVSWKKKGNGAPVTIHVTSHDINRPVGYYRWSYKEDWEIQAEFFANADYDIYTDIYTPYYMDGLNTYYCWNNDSSQVLILGDTEKLSGNLISEKRLLSIDPIDDKTSYLYSILVKQWSVSEPGYRYLENLQNNIDEAGSIFAPQPSELHGNIRCITDPEIPVIGYIEAATVTQKRIYIKEEEVKDSGRYRENCKIVEAEGKAAVIDSMNTKGVVILQAPESLKQAVLTDRRCVDCRLKGVKGKPSFWPNDHK